MRRAAAALLALAAARAAAQPLPAAGGPAGGAAAAAAAAAFEVAALGEGPAALFDVLLRAAGVPSAAATALSFDKLHSAYVTTEAIALSGARCRSAHQPGVAVQRARRRQVCAHAAHRRA
jgi:hypothetical protein